MLSRDSVHLSELQRDPNKYVKYKFKKTIFLSPEIVKWNSFMLFLLMMMNSASASLQGRHPFNQHFRKFRSKTQWIGSVQPEKFRKSWSTFRGGPLFPVGPLWILVEWMAPQVLWMSAACISLHAFQRTLRVSVCRGYRTWRKVTKPC